MCIEKTAPTQPSKYVYFSDPSIGHGVLAVIYESFVMLSTTGRYADWQIPIRHDRHEVRGGIRLRDDTAGTELGRQDTGSIRHA